MQQYDTYADLPATAEEGSFAQVTTTNAAGVWQFVASVDTYTVNMWFPSWIAARITGYVSDDSGNPYRVSTSIGSETLSILTSRGWYTTDSVLGATVTDAPDGTIRFFGGATQWGEARLRLDIQTALPDRLAFMVLEANVTKAGAANVNTHATLATGTGKYGVCFSNKAGFENRVRFHNPGSTNSTGYGYYDQSSFERIFVLLGVGPNNEVTSGEPAEKLYLWPASAGYGPPGSVMATVSQVDSGASTLCGFLAQTTATNENVEMFVREAHAFFMSP